MPKRKSKAETRPSEVSPSGPDLDALALQCQNILDSSETDSVRLNAIETLRRIAESRLKVIPQSSREEILRSFTDAEIQSEMKRRGLSVIIAVKFDRK